MKRTVFIVGAGASVDFGIPLGSGLVDQIRIHLLESISNFDPEGAIAQAMHSNLQGDYSESAREVAAGMTAARSIDRFLDSRQGKDLTTLVGKCAIAHRLLEAERISPLSDKGQDPWENAHLALYSSRNTWLHKTFSILHEGIKPEDALEVFKSVSFITFNYDRCIERYLRLAFEHSMNLTRTEALRAANSVPLVHVYGTLGPLEDGDNDGIPYGASPSQTLHSAQNIRTFTEGATPEIRGKAMQLIDQAEQIIFLGFAFDRMNVDALFRQSVEPKVEIKGTMYQLADSELEYFRKNVVPTGNQFLENQSCESYCSQARFRASLER